MATVFPQHNFGHLGSPLQVPEWNSVLGGVESVPSSSFLSGEFH